MARPAPPTQRVDPRWLRQRLTQALTAPPAPPIKVYDATGRLIATVDPITKRRSPVRE